MLEPRWQYSAPSSPAHRARAAERDVPWRLGQDRGGRRLQHHAPSHAASSLARRRMLAERSKECTTAAEALAGAIDTPPLGRMISRGHQYQCSNPRWTSTPPGVAPLPLRVNPPADEFPEPCDPRGGVRSSPLLSPPPLDAHGNTSASSTTLHFPGSHTEAPGTDASDQGGRNGYLRPSPHHARRRTHDRRQAGECAFVPPQECRGTALTSAPCIVASKYSLPWTRSPLSLARLIRVMLRALAAPSPQVAPNPRQRTGRRATVQREPPLPRHTARRCIVETLRSWACPVLSTAAATTISPAMCG